ncbi:MAG: SDR family oxidoreductase [Candidatus Parabeggiatoa sp.]|nr:SDR family oxidoreductase [Candidatus Parabeggiatoa sp.]
MNQEKFLHGRSAIVTGGATGMGRAIALALTTAGAKVAIGSRSAAINVCQDEFEALGGQVLALNVDICVTAEVAQFYHTVVETFGKVDILVNAAGIFPEHTLCNHPDDLWHQIIDVNINGVYRTIKLCLPEMISHKWGRIINIASTAASIGSATYPAYCASKAAVVGLTRCVALEGAPYSVTCNAISPGWVETDTAKRMIEQTAKVKGRNLTDSMAEIIQANPQQRMIQPTEIAHLAVFLCREESIGLTMQDITVSAGSIW